MLVDPKALAEVVKELKTDQDKMDFLTIRNGLLAYAALQKERCREMDIVFDGFDHI